MFCLTDEQYQMVQKNLIAHGNANVSQWNHPRKFWSFGEMVQYFLRHPIQVVQNKKITL